MKRYIPFTVWFSDFQTLLNSIEKTKLSVLDKVGSYDYGDFHYNKPNSNTYEFRITKSASQWSPPPPAPTSAAAGYTTVTTTAFHTTLTNYDVIIRFDKDGIHKLDVIEHWRGSTGGFTFETTIHSIIFGDEFWLVNNEWFELDSPKAFIHDATEDAISVLALIEEINKVQIK